MRFKEKVIFVTGAAGMLGQSLTDYFINQGAKVWLSDINKETLDTMTSKIPENQFLGSFCLDVSSEDQVKDCFQEVSEFKKGLDVLINNAGIGVFSPFWERDYRDFMQVMNVNAGGTFLCSREALKIMKESKEGSIVNIGSIYGVVSSDPRIYTDCNRLNSEVYSASKAAVIQLTKYLAVHASEFGVRVNCVSPGGIFDNQGDDFVANYSFRTPMGRMAQYKEIIGAISFLASDEASYVTGQNLLVDGGLTAW